MLGPTTHDNDRKSRKGTSFLIAVILIAVAACAIASPLQAQVPTPLAPPLRTALVIIDVQEFYFPGGTTPLDNPRAASLNVKRLLDKWREEARPVIHIGHNARQGAAFHADVVPAEGEKVIIKDEVNAFNGTKLLAYLQDNQIEQLVICGMQTHMCVEAAVRAAHDLGFRCILVHDACATRDLTFAGHRISATDVHRSTLSSLHRIYAEVVDTETVLNTH